MFSLYVNDMLNIALRTCRRDIFVFIDNNHSLLTFVSRTPFPSVSYNRNMTEKKKASPSLTQAEIAVQQVAAALQV